jgi:hypothetical protein
MKTHFAYELLYSNRSLVMGDENSLDKTKEMVNKDSHYYITECNYSPITVLVEERCSVCGNTGKIRKYKRNNKLDYKLVKCPECLGHIPVYKEEYQITE